MFAGPNGSGKSTLKTILPAKYLGVYINPDEIEQKLHAAGELNLSEFGVFTDLQTVREFFQRSAFLQQIGMQRVSEMILFGEGKLTVPSSEINAYVASVIADFIRKQLLSIKADFTFETVMSSKDKVELMQQAQGIGYRTYLYFIATDDPEINITRVKSRVMQGGHPVPDDKVKSRYFRSLELLKEAIKFTNRAYIFDNSSDGKEINWFAEVTDASQLEFKTDFVPGWFKGCMLGF